MQSASEFGGSITAGVVEKLRQAANKYSFCKTAFQHAHEKFDHIRSLHNSSADNRLYFLGYNESLPNHLSLE